MAEFVCALDEILDSGVCNERGGIRVAYWTEYNGVDWDTMLGDNTKFNATTGIILGYTMLGGAVFNKVDSLRKEARYQAEFTSDTDLYTTAVNFRFRGKSNTRKNSLQNAITCCAIVLHIYSNDGTQRVIGVDWNGATFNPYLEPLRISRHLDAGGQLSTSKAGDELDLSAESYNAPVFADVDEADLPL